LFFVHESRLLSLSLLTTCAALLLACSDSTTPSADGGALDAGRDPITGEPGMDAGTTPPARDAGDSYDPDDPPGGEQPDGGSDQVPGGDGDGDDGDGEEPDPPDGPSDDELEWRRANLTEFISYPDPDSDECKYFNGCEYPGYFAAFNGMQQSMDWVDEHNILAVHSRDFDTYVWKTLRIRADGHEIDAVVYDLCSDSDCNGCCTNNASETGFLIDMETHTKQRFGGGDGVVEWACVDCD
jgi:hypothetical protein